MKITLKRNILDNILDCISSEETRKEIERDARYTSTTFTVTLESLSKDDLASLRDCLKSLKSRVALLKVTNYISYINNETSDPIITDSDMFTSYFTDIIKKTPRHWIFRDGKSNIKPYLVYNVTFEPAKGRGDTFEEARTSIAMVYNFSSKTTKNIFVYESSVKGKKLSEILRELHITFATQDLIDDYEVNLNKYLDEKHNFNKQYVGSDVTLIISAARWGREEKVVSGNFINDEEINQDDVTLKGTTKLYPDEICDIPCHCYLYVYSLSTYENGYVHISELETYEYDDSLRNKLILPKTHSDLLDILTNDLSILSGDIIKGKSSGTTILCKGIPGTGKTLTAEVYSEITHRPLYKVNSGQLGVTPEDVEKNLEAILRRAERWNAVMLLDEADTYIRKRGNDMDQNAIVAAFLRTLEYFHGLMFMTTNRINDVDDAIESRCIAQILYEAPAPDDAKLIWQTLANEFNLSLSSSLIDKLVLRFPEATGRDIKELLRLTGRFCTAKDLELSESAFISCAQFRAIKMS